MYRPTRKGRMVTSNKLENWKKLDGSIYLTDMNKALCNHVRRTDMNLTIIIKWQKGNTDSISSKTESKKRTSYLLNYTAWAVAINVSNSSIHKTKSKKCTSYL